MKVKLFCGFITGNDNCILDDYRTFIKKYNKEDIISINMIPVNNSLEVKIVVTYFEKSKTKKEGSN